MPTSLGNTTTSQVQYKEVYFYNSLWLPAYTFFCVLGSFPFLIVTIPLGLTVASDTVFGALVIVGGPLGDYLFRMSFKRIMLIAGKVQAIWTWPLIGLLVMIFHPFE